MFSLLKEKKIQRRKYEGEVREVDKTYIEGGKEKKKKIKIKRKKKSGEGTAR